MDKASTQLTKTAFTVTVLFIIFSIGFGAMSNILQLFGVIDFNKHVLLAVLCMTTLNSVVNPFVYECPFQRESEHGIVLLQGRKE